ncbi:hypothetical protein BCR36DRAFT_582056 [Piromyces finnis]|uniref:Uncharacterized protein n=1 Tax=Piromyces finnis TaxID=1754191 RepID=A0A1Y1VDU3_9FUNG|nr:hypothetical protein BCR36DRAFT_582056 [Piromyces finnis]|eukprot:ORX53794.1 hypothetical protein BCR36DRAFT_582056 [Piromyces finnis]
MNEQVDKKTLIYQSILGIASLIITTILFALDKDIFAYGFVIITLIAQIAFPFTLSNGKPLGMISKV